MTPFKHLISIELKQERTASYRKTIQLPECTRDVDLLMRLLRHHLEQVQLKNAISGVSIGVEPVAPLAKQAGLFEHSVRNPWRLAETLDQLAGIIGSENFGAPRTSQTHQPDQFFLEPLPVEVIPKKATNQVTPTTYGLPLKRYRPPVPCKISLHNHKPAAIQSQLISGRIHQQFGPYKTSGNWWSIHAWKQAEWDIEVTHTGIFRISQTQTGWQIEGHFD